MTTDIESQPNPVAALPDPIATATTMGTFFGGLDQLFGRAAGPFSAIRMGELTRLAVETDSRKRASYFATPHITEIHRYLRTSGLELFAPHAASELQSALDAGFRVPFRKRVDVLAPIPGDQFVIVASRTHRLGAALLDGELPLRYWTTSKPALPQDIVGRVQIGNALDVIAVLMLAPSDWT